MKKTIKTILCALLPAIVVAQTPNRPITFTSALNEILDISTLPAYLDRTICAQVSSYDTTGGNDDGFSGKYSYLTRNADSTLVIFDVRGPGVINRIWTPTPSDDSLAFYIDNLSKPAIILCYSDLFSGKVFPFVQPLCNNQLGGYYCYLPIPFQRSCRIVYRGKKTQFHQIQYRKYPEGTHVNKFTLPLTDGEQKALKQLQQLWKKPERTATDFVRDTTQNHIAGFQLRAGTIQPIFNLEKGGRLLGIEFEGSSLQQVASRVDLRITWDNETTPAVFCPLSDFFGYAFGKPSMASLLVGSTGEKLYCYFPMPFDKSAVVELIYRKDDRLTMPDVPLRVLITYSMTKRKLAKEGKFYSNRIRSYPTRIHEPHLFLATNGKGHYVGSVLQARGLSPGMTYFFEGDDSTAVDGEFRMHGTGSEDYFNGGWYALPDRWDAPMSLPMSGALDYSLPFCRTGGYRLFLSDKISFEKKFYHSIEHGPTDNVSADYTSVSYYYCDTPPERITEPTNLNTRIIEPDTLMLYPQLMNLGIDGTIETSQGWTYPTGGQTFTFKVTNGSGIRMPLDVPVGHYKLFLDDVVSVAGCSFSVWQRQTQLSGWMDRYGVATRRQEMTFLCDLTVGELVKTITLRFKTQKEKDRFIFNRLILVRN